MSKIFVIITGGTIGSSGSDGVIDASPEASVDLIHRYRLRYGNDAEFDLASPYNILSENLTPKHWELLCGTIAKTDYSRYDGIIVTHGSDTLSYTSALLALAFNSAPIPIVLVAGNLPLGNPLSNGLANFRNAVCLIKSKAAVGVFSVYQDALGKNNVYLGSEIVEADPNHHSFSSCRAAPFGEMVDEKLIVLNPADGASGGERTAFGEEIRFSKKVLLIRPYPGQDYRVFHPPDDTAAVLHRLYHSSTACTGGGEYSVVDFIKACVARGIDFYVAPYKPPGSDIYAGSESLVQAGAVPLYDASPETAYARLMLKYNK